LVEYIRNSSVFQRFIEEGGNIRVTEAEIRNFLRCTLESPERVIRQNLEYFRKVGEAYGEAQIVQFIDLCSKRLFGGGETDGEASTD